jgi:hypothetical protein
MLVDEDQAVELPLRQTPDSLCNFTIHFVWTVRSDCRSVHKFSPSNRPPITRRAVKVWSHLRRFVRIGQFRNVNTDLPRSQSATLLSIPWISPSAGSGSPEGAPIRGGGEGWIRTSVRLRGQIYSLLPLTTRPPLQTALAQMAVDPSPVNRQRGQFAVPLASLERVKGIEPSS